MTDHWFYLPGLSYTCYYLAGKAQVASWGPGQGSLGISGRSTWSTRRLKKRMYFLEEAKQSLTPFPQHMLSKSPTITNRSL